MHAPVLLTRNPMGRKNIKNTAAYRYTGESIETRGLKGRTNRNRGLNGRTNRNPMATIGEPMRTRTRNQGTNKKKKNRISNLDGSVGKPHLPRVVQHQDGLVRVLEFVSEQGLINQK
jgi:hypothetical protein